MSTIAPASSALNAVGFRVPIPQRHAPTRSAAPESPDPFQSLLGSVAAGDERALGALIELVGARVRSKVQRIVFNTDAAEDIAQDTWLYIWRRAHEYDPARGSALGWVLRVAHYRALEARRKQGRRKETSWESAFPGGVPLVEGSHGRRPILPGEANPLATPEVPTPLNTQSVAGLWAQVQPMLPKLTSHERMVLTWTYWDHMTDEEIAGRMGASPATVASVRRGAVLSLRDALSLTDVEGLHG